MCLATTWFNQRNGPQGLRDEREKPVQRKPARARGVIALAILLGGPIAALIFLDIARPFGIATGAGYAALVVFGLRVDRRVLAATAVVASALIVAAAFFWPQDGISVVQQLAGVSFAIASLWIIAFAAARRLDLEMKLRGFEEDLKLQRNVDQTDHYRWRLGERMWDDITALTTDEADLYGTERILVVDANGDMAELTSIALERLGYTTNGATDPLEALMAFEEYPTAWDAVIANQLMPGIGGVELLRRLKRINPSVKTVLCIGYVDVPETEILKNSGVDAFCSRPTDAKKIALLLRELFDTRGEAGQVP
jgi:CheY-like chemotaxis protein